MLTRKGLVFLQGDGQHDKFVSVRGTIDSLNSALASLRYLCRIQDGCVSGLMDTLVVFVDDDGFSGKGGPLTAQESLEINLVASSASAAA